MSTRSPARNKAVVELNKLRADDREVHDWYRFVLSFPPHLVREYLERFGVERSRQVLDPFCGTGTTLVECKKLGIPSAGVEANPMAWFASQVKTCWEPDADGLDQHASRVAEAAEKVLASDGIMDWPFFHANPEGHQSLRRLSPESERLLLRDSISPLPLHKTLVLLEALDQKREDRFWDHERLALANALVSDISNLRFGPEVGVGAVKQDPPVIAAWLNRVRSMVNDLRHLQSLNPQTSAQVFLGDARQADELLDAQSIDAVITSPPYPNEKDYTRTTRLESVLLGFLRNKEDLRSLKQGFVRSNTRAVYKADDDDQWLAHCPAIAEIAERIENRRAELGKTSGFERLYARVTKLYFGGMARHLANLRPVLRPGARLAYVVGDQASYFRVKIRTGQLLAEIGRSLGYDVEGLDLFRTRTATATREQLREEVLVFRWPG